MGGKAPGGGTGAAGKGGGGGTPMSATAADQANATRRQNVYTTVGGLSRPGGGSAPGAPPNPRVRPSGPAGPPKSPGGAGVPLPPMRPDTGPGAGLSAGALPAPVDESMAASPLSRLFTNPTGVTTADYMSSMTPEQKRNWAKTQSKRPLIPSSGGLPVAPDFTRL
jgi:hypothetical protein